MSKIKIKVSSIITLAVFSLLLPMKLWAAIETPAEAVHLATEQRSLSQAMLKNYILSGLGVRSRKADRALADAMASFEYQQQQLSQFITDNRVRIELANVDTAWQQVKGYYAQKPSQGKLKSFYGTNEALLNATNKLVQSLHEAGLSRATPMLDLSGELEFLCLRISALYGMMALGLEAEAQSSYSNGFERFSATVYNLQQLENTPLIGHNLKQLERQLERTRSTAAASQDTYIPGLIDRSVVKMLKQVDELQAEYLVLARTLDE